MNVDGLALMTLSKVVLYLSQIEVYVEMVRTAAYNFLALCAR